MTEQEKEYQRIKHNLWYKQRTEKEIKKRAEQPKKVTTAELEGSLPNSMKVRLKRIREAFLKIPILERPPYDEYLQNLTNKNISKW